MNNQDPRHIPLPRRYAPILGPLVGAAAGASGFLMMHWSDALWMVLLFAVIGLVAGIVIYALDRKAGAE